MNILLSISATINVVLTALVFALYFQWIMFKPSDQLLNKDPEIAVNESDAVIETVISKNYDLGKSDSLKN